MRLVIGVLFALTVVGCATGSRISMDPESQPTTITLNCPNDWAECYLDANRICGSRGFDEVDRMQSHRLTSSGRSIRVDSTTDQHPEDNRAEVMGRVLTIRCRQPAAP